MDIIPMRNDCDGTHTFHSIYEYMPVNSLKAAHKVVLEVIEQTRIQFMPENKA